MNPSSTGGRTLVSLQEHLAPPLPQRICSLTFHSQALAILAMPKHVPDALRELALLSDEIHFLSGDQSVDTSWYTKRAGLSAIYASTELFMTQDRSANFKETEGFLDRRLEGADALRRMVGDTGRWASVQAMGLVSGLRSKGVRI